MPTPLKKALQLTFFLIVLHTPFLSYAQECGNAQSPNLIINGDFGEGISNVSNNLSGINSSLMYTSTPPPEDGFYSLSNNTGGFGGFGDFAGENWINIGDNSSSSQGYFMIANPGMDGARFDYTINGCSGLRYNFSFDVINMFEPDFERDTLPQFQLLINDNLVADFGPLPQDERWYTFEHSFILEEEPTTISIIGFAADTASDVFGLDNILLQRCAPDLDLFQLDERPRCPGDDIVFGFTAPDSLNLFYQLEVSIDVEDSWIFVSSPNDNDQFIVNNIPPNARYRIVGAETEEGLNNPNCHFYTTTYAVAYTTPSSCQSVIESIGELCEGSRGDNIFPDGDFGSGSANVLSTDPRLAPGFVYQRNPPPNDGFYTITNNTGPWGSFANTWLNIQDNSDDPNGYMMVVNATFEPGIFYEKTVPVCENTNYEFSADIINITDPNFSPNFIAPNLSFLINDQVILETGNIQNDGNWRTFGFTFTTRTGVNAIKLTLRNNAPGGFGNDLALDNISFRPCGPGAAIPDSTEVCLGKTSTLDANITLADEFPTLAFQWQVSTDEGFNWADVPGENGITIDLDDPQAGDWYRLKLANKEQNLGNFSCQSFSNIAILKGQDPDQVIIDTICDNESVMLNNITFDTTGNYLIGIPRGPQDCDSVIDLRLTSYPSYEMSIAAEICQSDTFVLGSQTLQFAGNFTEVFQTVQGCDSTVNVSLVVQPEYEFIDTMILCSGESFNGRLYFQDTIESDFLRTVEGCDSVLSTYFRILPSQGQRFIREFCPGETFIGNTVNQDTLVSIGGFNGITCDSVTIYELRLFDDPPTEIQGPALICNDETATLSLPGFRNYQWSTTDTSQSILATDAGIYEVEVISDNNCIYRDSFELNVSTLAATTTSTDVNCFGQNDGQIRITSLSGGAQPYISTLNGQALGDARTFDNLAPGNYTLVIEEGNGCFLQEQFTLTEPPLFTLELTTDETTITLGQSTPLLLNPSRGAATIAWSPSDSLSCIDCLAPIANPTNNITYEAMVVDSAGCEANASIAISVDKNRRLYVPNAFSPNGDGINDSFFPFLLENVQEVLHFVITDRWGNILHKVVEVSPNDPVLEWDGLFNNQPMGTGVYLWRLALEFKDGVVSDYSGSVQLVR